MISHYGVYIVLYHNITISLSLSLSLHVTVTIIITISLYYRLYRYAIYIYYYLKLLISVPLLCTFTVLFDLYLFEKQEIYWHLYITIFISNILRSDKYKIGKKRKRNENKKAFQTTPCKLYIHKPIYKQLFLKESHECVLHGLQMGSLY